MNSGADGSFVKRLLWLIAIWAMSVAALGVVAAALRMIFNGTLKH